MSRKLIVEVVGDTKSLDRSLNKASRNVKGFSGDISKASRGAIAGSGAFKSLGRSVAFASGSFLGAAGFVAVMKQSIDAASDLHEEINKSEVVFGKASKSVEEFGKTSAESFGIAEHEAIGMAATFGNLLHPMGIARGQAAKMSVQFVKLAADLASFNNADPTEVLEAIQSGLAGQVRPLRQYGIFLSQARIKAEALAMGLLKGKASQQAAKIATEQLSVAQAKYNAALAKYGPTATQTVSAHVTLEKAQAKVKAAADGATGTLTNQQKVLATTSIIMRDSADAQGDFSRTSGGLANQQRILKAQLQNVEATIGTALMPTVLKVTKAMTEWLGKSENQKKIQKELNSVIETAGTVLGTLKGIVKNMTPVVQNLVDAVGGTRKAFELLFALGVATKLRAIGKAIGFIGTEATAASVGAGAAKGAGVAGLLVNLSKLAKLGTIVVAIDIVMGGHPFGKGPRGGRYSGSAGFGNLWRDLTPSFISGSDPTTITGPAGGAQTGGSGHGHNAPIRPPHSVSIPTSFSSTHETKGLAGYPAVDIATKVGSPILAPEDGGLTGRHFKPYVPGFGGWTCYFRGHESGNTYFITHLGSCRPEGFYKRGAVIGTGGRAVGGMQHVHVGIHQATSTTDTTDTTTDTGGATHIGGSKTAPAWKGATQATIIAAKASVTSMISGAKQVIGGMAGPMDEIERAAIAHLTKLKAHLHPHMTATDLARTKADIAKWGKVLNDEISAQTKAAKRAFDLAAKNLLRGFDKETAAGLKARAAPDETPTEKILRERGEARDDAARQQALANAQAAGDAKGVADALYDIETANLEKIAREERKAADEKAAKDQEDYQNAREDQRQALQDQLDDWETWLTNKKKSWNQFWAWIKANPNGGGVIPNIGETATAPTAGGPPGNAPKGNFGWSQPGNNGGWSQVGGSGGQGVLIPRMATGGIVRSPTLALVGESGPEAVIPLGRGMGNTYNISFPNYVGSRKELMAAVRTELFKIERANGTTGIG